MKGLVRKVQGFWKQITSEKKARNYALSQKFCSNCAGGLPIIFPVYLAGTAKNTGKFFKVIDRNNLQVVSVKAGLVAISNHSEQSETLIFRQIISGTIYSSGFREITELEYHFEFGSATQDINLMHTKNLNKA